jgi:hypothetical protein
MVPGGPLSSPVVALQALRGQQPWPEFGPLCESFFDLGERDRQTLVSPRNAGCDERAGQAVRRWERRPDRRSRPGLVARVGHKQWSCASRAHGARGLAVGQSHEGARLRRLRTGLALAIVCTISRAMTRLSPTEGVVVKELTRGRATVRKRLAWVFSPVAGSRSRLSFRSNRTVATSPSISSHTVARDECGTQSLPIAPESAVLSCSWESETREAFIRAAVGSSCSVLVRHGAGRFPVRATVGLVPARRLAAGHASGDGWAVGIGRARTTGLKSRESRRRVLVYVAGRACSAARWRSAMRC